MALVTVQVLLWSLTGLYMVSTDIHFIHGEELGDMSSQAIQTSNLELEFEDILTTYPLATHLSLKQRLGMPVYQFKLDNNWVVIHAQTGTKLNSIVQSEAENIAQEYLTKPLAVKRSKLLNEQSPFELSSRHLPSWQIDFENWSQPTIYVHQITGEVVTKRHNFWRIFDWMWRLHIMDYDDGENINNSLLTGFSLFSLIATFLGAILSYVWVKARVSRKLR